MLKGKLSQSAFDKQRTVMAYRLKRFGNVLSHRTRSSEVGWAQGRSSSPTMSLWSPCLRCLSSPGLPVSFACWLPLLSYTTQCSEEENDDVFLVSIF